MYLYQLSPARTLLCLVLFFSFFKSNAAGFTLLGTTIIDVSGCSMGGPTGKVDAIYWIQRNQAAAPLTVIKFLNPTPDISVSFSTDHLTFPGGAVAEPVTITFEITSGLLINNQVLFFLVVDDKGNRLEFNLILSGTCPRHNNDFIIRGDFQSVQAHKTFPVDSAIVEIYRDAGWRGGDQHVGSVRTDANGHFEVKLWADDVDNYYAKLLLNDGAGVYLHDWYDPNIKWYNSANGGDNDKPVIDLGSTIILADGGNGTPRSAVWQGARAAYQEFIDLFGVAPPIGDYEIVIQNVLQPWTARSTTNWVDGVPTFSPERGGPIPPTDFSLFRPYRSQFTTYSGMFHEFGHALRHTVDGNQSHYLADAARWTYARGHTICGSDPGYVEVEGFAFNEGWAEFWQLYPPALMRTLCPTNDLANMTNEGAVMNDIHVVAEAIDNCGSPSPFEDDRIKEQRRKMFSVINSGENIIHSEGEFRSVAAQLFPGCPFPPIGGVGVARGSLEVHPTDLFVTWNAVKRIKNYISYYQHYSDSLMMKIPDYKAEIRRTENCKFIPCAEYASILFRPAQAVAQSQYAKLIVQRYQQRLKWVENKKYSPEKLIQKIDASGEKQLKCFQQKTDHQYKKALLSNFKDLRKKGKSLDTDFSEILLALDARLKAIDLGGHENTRAFFPQAPESFTNGEYKIANTEYHIPK